MPSRSAVLVRPYHQAIRERVVTVLASADVVVAPGHIIAAGATDEQAVHDILAASVGVLVCPFHVHRGSDGARVDGLTLLAALFDVSPRFPWHVVMPVSQVGAAAFHLRVPSELPASIAAQVLVIPEAELQNAATIERVRRHVHVRARA